MPHTHDLPRKDGDRNVYPVTPDILQVWANNYYHPSAEDEYLTSTGEAPTPSKLPAVLNKLLEVLPDQECVVFLAHVQAQGNWVRPVGEHNKHAGYSATARYLYELTGRQHAGSYVKRNVLRAQALLREAAQDLPEPYRSDLQRYIQADQ